MMKQVLIVLIVLMVLVTGSLSVSPDTGYDIAFTQVEQRARELSPHIRLIRKEIQLKLNESNSYLQKSNPSLDYTREFVKEGSFSETEQVFSISKSFEMPWLYANRRKGHRYARKALEQEKETEIRGFVTRMKSGYTALGLMTQRLSMLKQVKSHLQKIAEAATLRKKEGFITGFQKNVVDIALLNLKGKILSLTIERRELENRWKIEMGLPPHASLHLSDATKISYKPLSIPISQLGNQESILKDMPGFARLEMEGRHLSTGLKIAKMSIVPNINLSAGYKEVGSNLKGYVFGLSFDLPILNQNRNAVRKKNLDLEIHNNRLLLFKQENRSRIKEMMAAIKEYTRFLSGSNPVSALNMEPVVAAFAEGTLSGGDMISILNTYLEAVEQYHGHLHAYLGTLFQMEAVTGKQLIAF